MYILCVDKSLWDNGERIKCRRKYISYLEFKTYNNVIYIMGINKFNDCYGKCKIMIGREGNVVGTYRLSLESEQFLAFKLSDANINNL